MKINLTIRLSEALFCPYRDTETDERVIAPRPEVWDWLQENVGDDDVHWFKTDVPCYPTWIAFNSDVDAMAFKLRWL